MTTTPDTSLPPGDLEILEFERVRWTNTGPKESVIRERFATSSTRYYLRLHRIMREPAALVYDPAHVRRLQRLQEQRRQLRVRR